MLSCENAIDLLLDFLEGVLDPDTVAELERHLAGCPPCVAYLRTYRQTPAVAREAAREPMPEDLKARLRAFLVARLSAPPA
jgi:anti-sigma factor (TIGR02949 family)